MKNLLLLLVLLPSVLVAQLGTPYLEKCDTITGEKVWVQWVNGIEDCCYFWDGTNHIKTEIDGFPRGFCQNIGECPEESYETICCELYPTQIDYDNSKSDDVYGLINGVGNESIHMYWGLWTYNSIEYGGNNILYPTQDILHCSWGQNFNNSLLPQMNDNFPDQFFGINVGQKSWRVSQGMSCGFTASFYGPINLTFKEADACTKPQWEKHVGKTIELLPTFIRSLDVIQFQKCIAKIDGEIVDTSYLDENGEEIPDFIDFLSDRSGFSASQLLTHKTEKEWLRCAKSCGFDWGELPKYEENCQTETIQACDFNTSPETPIWIERTYCDNDLVSTTYYENNIDLLPFEDWEEYLNEIILDSIKYCDGSTVPSPPSECKNVVFKSEKLYENSSGNEGLYSLITKCEINQCNLAQFGTDLIKIGDFGNGALHPSGDFEGQQIGGWNAYTICSSSQPPNDGDGAYWISGSLDDYSITNFNRDSPDSECSECKMVYEFLYKNDCTEEVSCDYKIKNEEGLFEIYEPQNELSEECGKECVKCNESLFVLGGNVDSPDSELIGIMCDYSEQNNCSIGASYELCGTCFTFEGQVEDILIQVENQTNSISFFNPIENVILACAEDSEIDDLSVVQSAWNSLGMNGFWAISYVKPPTLNDCNVIVRYCYTGNDIVDLTGGGEQPDNKEEICRKWQMKAQCLFEETPEQPKDYDIEISGGCIDLNGEKEDVEFFKNFENGKLISEQAKTFDGTIFDTFSKTKCEPDCCDQEPTTLSCLDIPDTTFPETAPNGGWNNETNVQTSTISGDFELCYTVLSCQGNTVQMVGLSDINSTASYTTLDCSFYTYKRGDNNDYRLFTFESGANQGLWITQATDFVGDEFCFRRVGATLQYIYEGSVIDSKTVPTTDLFFDNSWLRNGFWDGSFQISNVEICEYEGGLLRLIPEISNLKKAKISGESLGIFHPEIVKYFGLNKTELRAIKAKEIKESFNLSGLDYQNKESAIQILILIQE